MKYRVVMTAPADRNFREHFQWIKERSVQGADHWRARMIAVVRSLGNDPERHALARESAAFAVPIRCVLAGTRKSAFRILYYIVEGEVRVLAIRRPTQDLMSPQDLDDIK